MNIRYSMINTYLECPNKFKKTYLDGSQEKTDSVATLYGSAIHLALQTLFEGGDPYTVFDMYWNSMKNKPLDYGQFSWDYLNTTAKERFIPNFIRLHFKKFANPKMEETIEMPFYEEKDVTHTLSGTFDMAAEYEGKLSIVDWKTSSREYYTSKIYRNPQLYIYSALYNYKYGKLPEQVVYKVFIKKEGRIQTIKRDIDQYVLNDMMENVKAIVLAMLSTIRTGNYYCNFNSCYGTENCKLKGDRSE